MPTIRANGLDIALRGPRRRTAARPAPRRDVARSRGLRRPDPAVLEARSAATCRTRAATARPAGTPPTASATTGSSTTSPRSSTRSGSDTFHVVGFSMGAMTALKFGVAPPGAAPDADDRRDHDRARAADVGRSAADGPGADRSRGSGVGGAARPPPRRGSGRRRLAAAPAGDRRRRRRPAAPHAARAPPDRLPRASSSAATATRSSRSSTPRGSVASSPTGGCSSCPTAATR